MKIIDLNQIKKILKSVDIIPAIEDGFIAYSRNEAVIPPVGELLFKKPPGDVHIKYGYIVDDKYYVVKIASGFYENSKLNLPSSNGLMLLFSQKTGELLSIMLDEGYLTDLRTAAAGAIAAKYLAPRSINNIGIIGTGTQARLQLHLLKSNVLCREVIVFGRDQAKLLKFQADMQNSGFNIRITLNIKEITSNCSLIVTTTPATRPILLAEEIMKGTHITAVGTDTPNKQELDQNIFSKADIIVADSIKQCCERGDIAHAIKNKIITTNDLFELGNIIAGQDKGRSNDDQITVADLTGLAVQDIQIAKVVYMGAR